MEPPTSYLPHQDNFTKGGTVNILQRTYPTLDAIIRIINQIVNPALVVVGCINNLLVLIILSKPRYRNNANCFFLMSLAVFDTLNLIAIGIYFGEAMKVLIAQLGNIYCALFSFYVYFMVNMSNWIIVIITFTRFVAVVFPLRAALWCTPRTAKYYTLVLSIACATWSLPAGVYGKKPKLGTLEAWYCVIDMPNNAIALYETAQSLVWIFIPFLLIVCFNLTISYTIRKGKSDRKLMTSSQQIQNKDDVTVMAMVIAVTLVFLVLTFPYMLQTTVWRILPLFRDLNEYQFKQRYFSYTVTTVIHSSNYGINLFLYCVCCRRFRQDFVRMILCRWCS
jgi:hypothetical protein